MGMVSFSGAQEVNIKDNMLMTLKGDMVKCTGLMAASIEDFGKMDYRQDWA